MVNIDKILKTAIKQDISDIHLISGIKPTFRIIDKLVPYDEESELSKEDMFEIYDYFIRGNLEKDSDFKENKKLDLSYQFAGVNFLLNISEAEGTPVFTLTKINNALPSFVTLRIPEKIKKIIKGQGIILVAGKANSGKTTTINSLINEINEKQCKKIITLEKPIEYRHINKNSIIVQKEVGKGQDVLSFSLGAKNALKEDCDVLVIGEINDKETMDAAIEMAEAGKLVIASLNTRTCVQTIDRILSFYDLKEKENIKFLIATLLKAVISQRLLHGNNDELIMVPEVMIVENGISALIRKEPLNVSEFEEIMQNEVKSGNKSLVTSLAELFLDDKISLEQAKSQLGSNDLEILNRTIMQLKIKNK